MADDQDQEKTEPATPKKKDDARKKGQIAQSHEIPSVMVLLGALSVFYFAGGWMSSRLSGIMEEIFNHLFYRDFEGEVAYTILIQIFRDLIILLAPLLAVVMIAGVISNVVQTGFLLTGEPLVPKLDKLNPINGFKRLFSLRSWVEVVKAVLKVIIVGGMAYSVLKGKMEQLPGLVALDTADIMAFMGKAALRLGFYTCLVLMVLAAVDFIFQHWQHGRDLRMTKQEIKDEFRQREGDPIVRSRIRTIQREMAMRRMMASVPEATVVITNPTHLAVALQFERSMPAPRVVAKGAGVIAEKIKELARAHDVPIVEQKPLARLLYKNVEIDQYIPADLYHAVAEILAYVYRLKGLAHA
jgi:flagellar biosynthetic protein FlhB